MDRPPVDKDNGEHDRSESMSERSADSDLFHTAVDASKTWVASEDRDFERIDHVATLLRKRPLLPPDPADATKDWSKNVAEGIWGGFL